MNYYISDLHFGHGNIIKFDQRPFATVEEMTHVLIRNWNSTVTNQDTVYILGDFCWGKETDWIRILDKLNGNKVLIRGNHDIKDMSDKEDRGIDVDGSIIDINIMEVVMDDIDEEKRFKKIEITEEREETKEAKDGNYDDESVEDILNED